MPYHAEVPGRVGRKPKGYDGRKAAEPVQLGNCAGQPKGWGGRRSELSAGTDKPKGRDLRMEMGCLHRQVGTGYQTPDAKSRPEYGWHLTAIQCHD